MNQLTSALVATGTAIVGLALIAVLVSRNAQTPQVVKSVGDAFGGVLSVAVSPVTGRSSFSNGL